MKITLDTNVLLSATFWNGDSFRILEMVKGEEIEAILSDQIIEEYRKVLNYDEIKDKVKNKGLEVKTTLEELIDISKIVIPQISLNVIKDDPDDNRIIECAVEGKADYIITQDNHLLKLGEFEGIRIITPKEFLEILSHQEN